MRCLVGQKEDVPKQPGALFQASSLAVPSLKDRQASWVQRYTVKALGVWWDSDLINVSWDLWAQTWLLFCCLGDLGQRIFRNLGEYDVTLRRQTRKTRTELLTLAMLRRNCTQEQNFYKHTQTHTYLLQTHDKHLRCLNIDTLFDFIFRKQSEAWPEWWAPAQPARHLRPPGWGNLPAAHRFASERAHKVSRSLSYGITLTPPTWNQWGPHLLILDSILGFIHYSLHFFDRHDLTKQEGKGQRWCLLCCISHRLTRLKHLFCWL